MARRASHESLPDPLVFVPIWGYAQGPMQEECERAAKGRTKTPSLGLGHQVGGLFLWTLFRPRLN